MNLSAINTNAISQAFDRFNQAASVIAGGVSPAAAPTDTMDFTDAALALSEAKIDVAANVRVLKAGQEMVKNTLDLLA
jgi:hypothetical protein